MTDIEIIRELEKVCGGAIVEKDKQRWIGSSYIIKDDVIREISISKFTIEDSGQFFYYLSQLKDLSVVVLNKNIGLDLSGIRELKKLQSLALFDIEVPDLSVLLPLKSLKKLELYKNNISDYTVLSQFSSLRELDLSSNESFEDISFLKDVKTLTHLNLSDNKITDISPLQDLVNLTKLELDENTVVDLSPLENLMNLNELRLVNNSISDITPLENLFNLKELHLTNNSISDISPLEGLVNLTELALEENSITDISPLQGLVNLTKLELQENSVTDISSLKRLNNLVNLDLCNNSVTNISSLENLISLKRLSLGNNSIIDISPLQGLINLETIDLSANSIADISFLSKLINLRYLNLSECIIEDFSPLQSMVNLTYLYLRKNNLTDISFLRNLINLRFLGLAHNSIHDLLPLENLSNIKQLRLGKNKISDISPIKKLFFNDSVTIDLSANQLKSLPEWIISIKGRFVDRPLNYGINLTDNPLIDPPLEIVMQGKAAVKRYFDRKKREGSRTIREAKLILVGEGSAGKTSLQRKLLDSKAGLPEGDTRTRGIEIKDWEFKKGYVAHIWDFGGQDVYYPVHRFFLTEKSLFVLLASTRQERHNFDYWIPTIYQFGGKSPIMIGQTCHDGNVMPWPDIADYMGNTDFNIVRMQESVYYELNLKSRNRGLGAIKKDIITQLANLPHCRQDVPRSWAEVREQLKEKVKTHACISYDLFKEICNTVAPGSFTQAVDYSDCCDFFHSIGVLLWYRKNEQLREHVILRPEWAMNAVYKIIDDEAIQKRRGHILPEDFTRLWKDSEYVEKHGILKQMLEVFRVAFPKKHRKGEYILPARLKPAPPEKHWKEEDCLTIEYHFDFMPRGLLNQVSAGLSRYIFVNDEGEEEVWNNVVNFSSNNTACQMEENFFRKHISIRTRGEDSRGLLMLIEDNLREAVAQYKGVDYKILVPCSCTDCRKKNKVYWFGYEQLCEWYKERKQVMCNQSGNLLNIDDLLYNSGFTPDYLQKEKDMEKPLQTITIFLASSSELEVDRRDFEIFINRENKELISQGVFLRLELWEDFLDRMGPEGLQEEYNQKVRESDIFVSLFFTKAGKYTQKEFDTAYGQFIKSGKPSMYVYMKSAPVNSDDINPQDVKYMTAFKKKLEKLKHFPTRYKDINDLKYQFKMQLQKLLPAIIEGKKR